MSSVDQARVDRVLNRLIELELDGLVRAAAAQHKLLDGFAAILGRSRFAGTIRARHQCWYQTRHDSERAWSYPEIGALYEVDHTTVMNGVAKHARRLLLGVERPRIVVACSVPSETARCA